MTDEEFIARGQDWPVPTVRDPKDGLLKHPDAVLGSIRSDDPLSLQARYAANFAQAEANVRLDEVDDTLQAREASHGPYRRQAQMSQLLKAIVHGHANWKDMPAEHRESLDMILMKISRLLSGNSAEPDTWLDISGYAMLCYNLLTTGSHLK